jgi:DNA invertase Pin-like site-specific DNA recombinase
MARAGKHVTNEIFNVSLVEAVKAINDATSIANRTKADVRAAKAAAGKFGRPKRFERDGPEIAGMRFMLCEGMSVARVAKAFSVAPATIRNYIPTSEIQKLRPKS